MSGKTVEEIMKRRGRPGRRSVNIYHKMLLLGAILSALLVIGISPKLAIWAIGGALILGISLFFWARCRRSKKKPEQEQVKELDFPAVLPSLEKAPAGERQGDSEEETIPKEPEEITVTDRQQEEKVVEVREIFTEGKEEKAGVVPAPAEMEDPLEERVQKLEARVLDLEVKLSQLEKMAGLQVVLPKPGEEVDLQAAFSDWEEKEGVKTG